MIAITALLGVLCASFGGVSIMLAIFNKSTKQVMVSVLLSIAGSYFVIAAIGAAAKVSCG